MMVDKDECLLFGNEAIFNSVDVVFDDKRASTSDQSALDLGDERGAYLTDLPLPYIPGFQNVYDLKSDAADERFVDSRPRAVDSVTQRDIAEHTPEHTPPKASAEKKSRTQNGDVVKYIALKRMYISIVDPSITLSERALRTILSNTVSARQHETPSAFRNDRWLVLERGIVCRRLDDVKKSIAALKEVQKSVLASQNAVQVPTLPTVAICSSLPTSHFVLELTADRRGGAPGDAGIADDGQGKTPIAKWSVPSKLEDEILRQRCRDMLAAPTQIPELITEDSEFTPLLDDDSFPQAKEPQAKAAKIELGQCCECGKKSNLWLNLSSGFVGCGRRQYGVENSGCQNPPREGAGIRHYEANPDYHVAAKINSVSSVAADLYSYRLDSPVRINNLDKALARLQLSRADLQMAAAQSEDSGARSMAEMALSANQNLASGALGAITDATALSEVSRLVKGVPTLYPPYGIINVGQSCYMGVVLHLLRQMIAYKPSFLPDVELLENNVNCHLKEDFKFQFARMTRVCGDETALGNATTRLIKVLEGHAKAMVSELGDDDLKTIGIESTSTTPDAWRKLLSAEHVDNLRPGCVKPNYLKRIFGPEIASPRQQDAEEFLQILFAKLEREGDRVPELRQLSSEFAVRMLTNRGASLSERAPIVGVQLSELPRPGDGLKRESKAETPEGEASASTASTNGASVRLEDLLFPERSSQAQGETKGAAEPPKVAGLPAFVIMKIERMTAVMQSGGKFEARKLTTPVEVPTSIDLSPLCEVSETLSFGSADACPDALEPLDSETVAIAMSMGFNEAQINAAHTQTKSRDLQTLLDHIFASLDDAPAGSGDSENNGAAGTNTGANASTIIESLKSKYPHLSHNLIHLAFKENADTIQPHDLSYNNEERIEALLKEKVYVAPQSGSKPQSAITSQDGDKCDLIYELDAVVLHLGSNAHSGHYVAYRRTATETWTLFDDDRVSVLKPPLKPNFSQAYLLLYRRSTIIPPF